MKTHHLLSFALSIALVSPTSLHAQLFKDAGSVMEKFKDSSGYISSDRDRSDLKSTMSELAERATRLAVMLSGMGSKMFGEDKARINGSVQPFRQAAESVRDGAKNLADRLGGSDDLRNETEAIRRQVSELISDWSGVCGVVQEMRADLVAGKAASDQASIANMKRLLAFRNAEDEAQRRRNTALAAVEAARPNLANLRRQLLELDGRIDQVSANATGTGGTAEERIAAVDAWMQLTTQRANLSAQEEQAAQAQTALDNALYAATAEQAEASAACAQALGEQTLPEQIRNQEVAHARLMAFRADFGG